MQIYHIPHLGLFLLCMNEQMAVEDVHIGLIIFIRYFPSENIEILVPVSDATMGVSKDIHRQYLYRSNTFIAV